MLNLSVSPIKLHAGVSAVLRVLEQEYMDMRDAQVSLHLMCKIIPWPSSCRDSLTMQAFVLQ